MKNKIRNIFSDGPISYDFIINSIKKHSIKTKVGAHEIFLCQVRQDLIDEKKVISLNFSAQKEMANKVCHEIKEKTLNENEVECMHIYHSLGEVKVGQICFFVFISGKHRSNLNNLLKKIVKNIKQKAPIFGKETFEDDSYQWKKNK